MHKLRVQRTNPSFKYTLYAYGAYDVLIVRKIFLLHAVGKYGRAECAYVYRIRTAYIRTWWRNVEILSFHLVYIYNVFTKAFMLCV